jgi:dolichyl-phosphate beta-glucosyltransferase
MRLTPKCLFLYIQPTPKRVLINISTSTMEKKPYLSIIIPSYKEGKRIVKTLYEIRHFLEGQNYPWEILIIVDGSPDSTAEITKDIGASMGDFKVINNSHNRGKGYVVKQGMLDAKGELRLFLDADGSTSIKHLDTFLPQFKQGYEVVIGSRDIQGAFIQIHQPKYREILGNMGNWLVRLVLGLWKIPDTQCGFKILTERAAQEIFSRMVVDRFGFDFELLVLAKKLGFKIKQMPVRWLNEEASTVKLIGPNGFTQVLLDLFKTRWRLWFRKYD